MAYTASSTTMTSSPKKDIGIAALLKVAGSRLIQGHVLAS
jgi:hypothetical protein